jgi:hypothetical protein
MNLGKVFLITTVRSAWLSIPSRMTPASRYLDLSSWHTSLESEFNPISKYFPASTTPDVYQCIESLSVASEFLRITKKCTETDFSDCQLPQYIYLADGTPLSIHEQIGNGGYATVHSTNKSDMVLKLSLSQSLCTEIALLWRKLVILIGTGCIPHSISINPLVLQSHIPAYPDYSKLFSIFILSDSFIETFMMKTSVYLYQTLWLFG